MNEWGNEDKVKLHFLLIIAFFQIQSQAYSQALWLTGLLAFFFSGRMSHWGRKRRNAAKNLNAFTFLWLERYGEILCYMLTSPHWLYMEFMVNLVVRVERRDILFLYTQLTAHTSTHTQLTRCIAFAYPLLHLTFIYWRKWDKEKKDNALSCVTSTQ